MFGANQFVEQKDLVEAFCLLEQKYNLQVAEYPNSDGALVIHGHRAKDEKRFSIALANENNRIRAWTIAIAAGGKIGAYITIENKEKRPEKTIPIVVAEQPKLPNDMDYQRRIDLNSILPKPLKELDRATFLSENKEKKEVDSSSKELIASFYDRFYVDGHKGLHDGYLVLTDTIKKMIITAEKFLDGDQQLVIKNFGLKYRTSNIDLPAGLGLQLSWLLGLADCLDGKI